MKARAPALSWQPLPSGCTRRDMFRAAMRRHIYCLRRVFDAAVTLQCGQTLNEAELREGFALVPCSQRHASTERVYRRFLKAEGRLEETKPAEHLGQLLLRYRQYLEDVRGLAPATIAQHLETIDAFLASSLGPTGHLSTLTSEHVEIFVQTTSRQVRRQTLQHKVARLRAFLRYCADRGETSRGLAHIDLPRIYRGELPPRALGWDLIEKLLASVDRSDNLGRRDHAILHLMAYYGLRASEVASLTLDAVNWKTGTLRVDQRKTRSTLVLPLADQTLRNLDQYLANRRPFDEATAALFPTARSPIAALTNWGVCDVFTKRARKAGCRSMGSHPMRCGIRSPCDRRGRASASRRSAICLVITALRAPAFIFASKPTCCARWPWPCPAARRVEEDGHDNDHLCDAVRSTGCGVARSSARSWLP